MLKMFRTPKPRMSGAFLFFLLLSIASTVQTNAFARKNVSLYHEFACDHCQLFELPTDIPYTETIISLSLEWNSITDISNLPFLPKVESIYISHNLITTVRWDWFNDNAPRLVHLDLSSNQIARVSGRIEAHVIPNIATIDLSNNSISSFPEESFTFSAAKYAHVDVSKNPYRCDKQLCWLWNEARCLERCLRAGCIDFGPVQFRNCCRSCPNSFLYFGVMIENEYEFEGWKCESPERVEGKILGRVLEGVCGTANGTASEQSLTGQPETNTTATVEELTTPYTSTQMASTSVSFSSSSAGAQVTTSVGHTTFSSAATAKANSKVDRDNTSTKTIVAAAFGTIILVLIPLFALLARQRRAKRQHARMLQRTLQARSHPLVENQMYGTAAATDVLQVLRAGNQLIPNQMYAPNHQQRDPAREDMANQAMELNAEASSSQTEATASEDCGVDCRTEPTHAYVKDDDVNSVRQIVEANCDHNYVNEEGRYERIPDELDCSGVEPYAEIGLSDIAEDTVTYSAGRI